MLLASLVFGAAMVRPTVVCIDPGHPSEVGAGTKGKRITEVHAAWLVALALKSELVARGYDIRMTKRTEGQHVTNQARAEVANACKAAVMVRLHCDSAPGERGIATYYASRQGTIRGVTGPDPSVLAQVKPMAQRFHTKLIASLDGALQDRTLRTDLQTAVGAKHGALIGSIFSKQPSILVEMCVLSDARDEAFIVSSANQKKLARALADATEAAIKP